MGDDDKGKTEYKMGTELEFDAKAFDNKVAEYSTFKEKDLPKFRRGARRANQEMMKTIDTELEKIGDIDNLTVKDQEQQAYKALGEGYITFLAKTHAAGKSKAHEEKHKQVIKDVLDAKKKGEKTGNYREFHDEALKIINQYHQSSGEGGTFVDLVKKYRGEGKLRHISDDIHDNYKDRVDARSGKIGFSKYQSLFSDIQDNPFVHAHVEDKVKQFGGKVVNRDQFQAQKTYHLVENVMHGLHTGKIREADMRNTGIDLDKKVAQSYYETQNKGK